MSKDMLGRAVRKLVTLPAEVLGIVCDLLQKLDDPEWVEATKRFLRKENPWVEVALAVDSLLKKVTEVVVPAVADFSTAVFFQTGGPVGWTSDNFRRMFSDHVEPETPDTTLRIHQLTKPAKDPAIIDELGGEGAVEATLGQMWRMIEKQAKGQEGKLLTNGYANLFYIRSQVDNQLWAVNCGWGSGGRCWSVCAAPVSSPLGWSAGCRVVSRDS